MIVFKTFLKVLNKCKMTIILYTVMLIVFGVLNMQTSDSSTNFVASKPDVLIINNDKDEGITKDLIKYITDNSNIIELDDSDEAREDALFYRDVNYIIYIPKDFRDDFLRGKNPEIEVKSTGDYQSAFAQMLLERYIKIAKVYVQSIDDEDELIAKINETISKETEVEMTSKLDTNSLTKASFYYNFASYSLLAGCVYVICLILSSFRDEKIRKRTVISSMNYKTHNRQLLLSNMLFAIVLWVFYVLVSFVLVGDLMFTAHGVVYMVNALVFTICALSIAFLIGNLITNKEAINGIVNVVALGSSFLCGAFVPAEWLPDAVLKIAHVLPTYYYINSNDRLKMLEVVSFESLKPIILNMGIIVIFILGFVALSNIVARKKRKLG